VKYCFKEHNLMLECYIYLFCFSCT